MSTKKNMANVSLIFRAHHASVPRLYRNVACLVGWMAKIQFLPALLALNVGVVIILIALTLLFGRVYCSVICPLGVFQDVVSWLGKKRKKNRYSYSPALNWLRYGVLGVFVVALIAGVGSLVALLAPYSSYGRIASNLFAPVYQWGNNLLALLAERADSYMFYSVDVWVKATGTLAIAALTFVVLAVLGLAQWTHVLQHDLSGGYGAGILLTLLFAETCD